jgi:hypothetical protein
MGHKCCKTAQHHDHHTQVATTAHEQNFNVFDNVGRGITRAGFAGG